MNVNVEKNNGLCKMQIEGEMTIFTAAELKEELIDNLGNCSDIEIDLSRVSEMDTSGLQLLLLIYREASILKKSVRLISYSPSVAAVFDLFSIDREEF
jgi:anti-anti-sigma factor